MLLEEKERKGELRMNRDEKAREQLKQKIKKKILIHGAPCNTSTGNGKLIYHIAQALLKAGHEVYTIGIEYNRMQIAYRAKNTDSLIPIMPSFHCERCGNTNRGSEFRVGKIAEYINKLQPDFFLCVGDPIQSQQFGMGNMNFEVMKNTHALIYATLDSDGVFCNENLIANGMRDYVKVCDRIISTAKHTQEQFKKWMGLDTDLIYETIDFDTYKPVSKETKTEIRKKHRFKEDDFIIYYSGRNGFRKEHNILFEAVAQFLNETENTYFYVNIPLHVDNITGYVTYPDDLHPVDYIKRILKNKWGRDFLKEGRIVFADREGLGSFKIGELENAELYQLSDVFACTTAGEGFGLAPVESMGCGVPAILPNNSTGEEILGRIFIASIPDKYYSICQGGLLTDTVYTRYADYGLNQDLTNVKNTYQAIKRLHEDPELREQLGKQGLEHVKKTFSMEEFNKKWIEIIRTTKKKELSTEENQGFKKLEINEEGEEKNE